MNELKESFEPPVTLALYEALGFAPKIVQDRLFNLLTSRATAVMTNVAGPQHPLYLAGARLKQVVAWVPRTGDIGMGVSILSFNGMVQFGLMTDTVLVPDPQAIIAHFKPKFEQLLYFVLMEPLDDEAAEKPSKTEQEPRLAASPRSRGRDKSTASLPLPETASGPDRRKLPRQRKA